MAAFWLAAKILLLGIFASQKCTFMMPVLYLNFVIHYILAIKSMCQRKTVLLCHKCRIHQHQAKS